MYFQLGKALLLYVKYAQKWEVVVAQLVERSLSIPEVRGSTPVIGKIYWTFVYCQLYWKDENKEKEAGNGPLLKKSMPICCQLIAAPST